MDWSLLRTSTIACKLKSSLNETLKNDNMSAFLWIPIIQFMELAITTMTTKLGRSNASAAK
ncbi:MAG: hypothetical protein COT73_02685 [Bdellovibrio sp. CG10_big_fil_rev_8_21_14_0_10_47_8]|nr:MAG: hypothetical protein COT73_02685 [Bdellovibrio sp. CG10_big_fil_rev_8_21_14_0_10_47_8]